MTTKNWWWGRSASIDLHDCDVSLITNKKVIAKFVKELTQKLKMKRVGPAEIKRFGHGQLRGYSLMQFIETSTIVAHFDEFAGRAFIDVFSCKRYNSQKIAPFCQKYFKAKNYKLNVLESK